MRRNEIYNLLNKILLLPSVRTALSILFLLVLWFLSSYSTPFCNCCIPNDNKTPALGLPFARSNLDDLNHREDDDDDDDDFYRLLIEDDSRNNEVFVDKSSFIEEYLRSFWTIILITRPRQWGKTTNMKMLKRFLEIEVDRKTGRYLPKDKCVNRKLFEGGTIVLADGGKTRRLLPLKISSSDYCMGFQGQFPVLYVNFRNVTGVNYVQVERALKIVVSRLYDNYRYLEATIDRTAAKILFNSYRSGSIGSRQDLEKSLLFLSELLCKHFKRKVHIFIDDYDAPINNLFVSLIRRFKEETPPPVSSHTEDELDLKEEPAAAEEEVLSSQDEDEQEEEEEDDDEEESVNNNSPFGRALASEELENVTSLFKGLLSYSFKNNVALEKGLLTGTLYVQLADSISGGLNYIMEYNILDKQFSRHYGFSKEEVHVLLKKTSLMANSGSVKAWYDGYNHSGIEKYNPSSISRFIKNGGKFRNYWWRTESDKTENDNYYGGDPAASAVVASSLLPDEILELDQVQTNVHKLADGKGIGVPCKTKITYDYKIREALFSILLYSGYLKTHPFNGVRELSSPNIELTNFYRHKIRTWVYRKFNVTSEQLAYVTEPLLRTVLEPETFLQRLERRLAGVPALANATEIRAIYYDALVRTLTYTLESRYNLTIKRQSGAKRPHIILISKKTTEERNRDNDAIILQYKTARNIVKFERKAKIGLDKLREQYDNTYIRKHCRHVKRVMRMCLVFHGQKPIMRYNISETVLLDDKAEMEEEERLDRELERYKVKHDERDKEEYYDSSDDDEDDDDRDGDNKNVLQKYLSRIEKYTDDDEDGEEREEIEHYDDDNAENGDKDNKGKNDNTEKKSQNYLSHLKNRKKYQKQEANNAKQEANKKKQKAEKRKRRFSSRLKQSKKITKETDDDNGPSEIRE